MTLARLYHSRRSNRLSTPLILLSIFFFCIPLVFAEHDFTIRGQFTCTNHGITLPVEGAVVGIMRDKKWAADPIVTEIRTAADGTFDASVKAKDVDSYYAKLFLNDKEGVFLRDWWTLSVKEINSANREKNQTSLVDLGTSNITREDGRGTPQCAIWQGGRVAWQEYMATTGNRPLIGEHGNYQIVMESTDSGIVWTSRDTTHWEMGFLTTEFAEPPVIPDPMHISYQTLFQLYTTNIHEFGHALRHTADGSEDHFSWDATRFFYGHTHTVCGGSPSWVANKNEGFAFNEGWAEYWSNLDRNYFSFCATQGLDLKNFIKEGAVANDLEVIANSLNACAGINPNLSPDETLRERRNRMFTVLSGAGHEKIHSDHDFRVAFASRFPACSLPEVGTSITMQSVPFEATVPLPSTNRLKAQFVINKTRLVNLNAQLGNVDALAVNVFPNLTHEQRVTTLAQPVLLRGQIAYSQLFEAHLSKVIANPPTAQYLMSAQGAQERANEVAAFDRDAHAIALDTLIKERAVLLAKDAVEYQDEVSLLDQEIKTAQSGSNRAVSVMLQDVLTNDPDEVSSGSPVHR